MIVHARFFLSYRQIANMSKTQTIDFKHHLAILILLDNLRAYPKSPWGERNKTFWRWCSMIQNRDNVYLFRDNNENSGTASRTLYVRCATNEKSEERKELKIVLEKKILQKFNVLLAFFNLSVTFSILFTSVFQKFHLPQRHRRRSKSIPLLHYN